MGVIQCTDLKMVCSLKTTDRRVKQTEILGFGGSCNKHMGYLVFKAIFSCQKYPYGHYGLGGRPGGAGGGAAQEQGVGINGY